MNERRMSPYARFKGAAAIPSYVKQLGRVAKVITRLGRSKYMPHASAKENARHAGKTSLGPNASRALRVS